LRCRAGAPDPAPTRSNNQSAPETKVPCPANPRLQTVLTTAEPRDPTPLFSPSASPERSHLRRLREVSLQNPLNFLTCCTAHRRPLLASFSSAAVLAAAFADSRQNPVRARLAATPEAWPHVGECDVLNLLRTRRGQETPPHIFPLTPTPNTVPETATRAHKTARARSIPGCKDSRCTPPPRGRPRGPRAFG